MNFNLLNELTKEDKIKIENYIKIYGVYKDFIGIDKWLKYWSINKIKMYKLLGNKLIYRVPFEYNKSQEELNGQLSNLICYSNFPKKLHDWLHNHSDIFPDHFKDVINSCCLHYILASDEIRDSIKFKLEGEKKTFQIQKGQKPIRVLGRFLTYCKNIDDIDKIMQAYEEFRLAHSMILNDKTVKGNIVISIHPLDFMTMSDNKSNWHSCMSWEDHGCYRVGTIEMMNSNNVLCCYIENEEPYYFSTCEEEYKWNNKKWRQLVYFTKDIIVGGKPYPYHNDEISKALIKIIRDLAKENLNWTYSFGPELYKDMIHITGSYSMERAKGYIHYKDMKKHNILFDTKGMYNDMLNDSNTNYWCVRNKVKHNKVISYSGKAPCLCCGEPIIYEEDIYEDYNERYGNCSSVVCSDCLDIFRCDFCNEAISDKKHYDIFLENNKKVKICEDCVEDYIRECPDCGKSMFTIPLYGYYNIIADEKLDSPTSFIKIKDEIKNEEFFNSSWVYNKKEKFDSYFDTVYPICRCRKCTEKDSRFEIQTITDEKHNFWIKRARDFYVSKNIEDKEKWIKYFPFNLKKIKICDGEVITS